MEKKTCYGSIEEITDSHGLTTIKTRPQCRECLEFRECLRQSQLVMKEKRERNELRKQNLIAQIIDLSHMISNEIGSCLLDFLNRIYDSPLGTVLFRNLLLFCEIPKELPSYSLNFPISLSTLEWIQGGGEERRPGGLPEGKGRDELDIRIIVIQKHFPGNRKANMGMIAQEVTRQFSSDPKGTRQILQTLEPSEINQYKKMDAGKRIGWLMKKWGFQEEYDALKEAMASTNSKVQILKP